MEIKDYNNIKIITNLNSLSEKEFDEVTKTIINNIFNDNSDINLFKSLYTREEITEFLASIINNIKVVEQKS